MPTSRTIDSRYSAAFLKWLTERFGMFQLAWSNLAFTR